MRISLATYRKIVLVALVALIAIIITGGVVRLTGSGLGCADWPGCTEEQFIAEPSDFHAQVEFINRVVTGIVSVAVILAVLGAIFLESRKKNLIWWSLGLVAGVLAQVFVGAAVVDSDLAPEIVMTHFLLSMLLVYNATVLYVKTSPPNKSTSELTSEEPASSIKPTNKIIVMLTRLGTLVTIAVIFVGTILTGSGPHSGDAEIKTVNGEEVLKVPRFNFDIENLSRIHGSLVVFLLSIMAAGWILLYKFHRDSREQLWKKGTVLLFVTLSQGIIGWAQYLTEVPALLVGFHIAGASILWCVLIIFYLEACPPIQFHKRITHNQNKN